ncbi:phenylalanine--tRNA ligase beta subunit-related protein [Paenibacillus kribbensis]|uniref:B3/B4 domain-containing protein n=1 Tax=Paenibacillus kribbensis TaxID=172713 RepID=UPI002DBA06D1|nr:phenylalanine--tRNA ligase beta subunit-related protein [Paenibacillus kribbensis]MEC0237704.1 phenylalanine--tRNA ligase beta subunit-related protein [Paenibacillus kribbensis]
MKFLVEDKVFETLDTVCFAVVIAHGIDNTVKNLKIQKLLEENMLLCQSSLEGVNVKEIESVLCYREAFRKLNVNPNKYMCSIEALLTRISKGKGMPNINTVVDLGNAVSLKYKIPIGAHDIDTMNGEMTLRFSEEQDFFLPFGSTEIESVDKNEIVYATGNSVRTRRWTWRQSEEGKITTQSKNIFFPIDGFSDTNMDNMLSAQKELGNMLKYELGCNVSIGWVDAKHKSFSINAI